MFVYIVANLTELNFKLLLYQAILYFRGITVTKLIYLFLSKYFNDIFHQKQNKFITGIVIRMKNESESRLSTEVVYNKPTAPVVHTYG